MTHGPTARRPVWSSLAAALLIPGLLLACEGRARRERSQRASDARDAESSRPLPGRGRRRPGRRRRDPGRHVRLDEGTRARRLASASTSWRRRRSRRCSTPPTRSSRGGPTFRSRSASTASRAASARCVPIQPYDRAAIRERAGAACRGPGGGTAIGDAMREARPDLYRAGVFRKYLLVVTDGENTNGREPGRRRARHLAQERGRACRSTSSRSTPARRSSRS